MLPEQLEDPEALHQITPGLLPFPYHLSQGDMQSAEGQEYRWGGFGMDDSFLLRAHWIDLGGSARGFQCAFS